MRREFTHLNFPIGLLQKAFIDIRSTMNDIMDYAVYVRAISFYHEGKIENSVYKAAHNDFGIKLGNPQNSASNGKILFESKTKKAPMTGISKKTCFDFYDNEKTESEIAVLLAYLAIKSIIGTKPYVHITNEFLIARMGGFPSIKAIPEELPEPLAKFATRRRLDKIKFELRKSWNVTIYGFRVRGFYVSIENQFSLEDLIYEVEKRRKSATEMKLRQKQNEAILKAKTKLRNELDSRK